MPQNKGAGYTDVLVVLQVPGNKAGEGGFGSAQFYVTGYNIKLFKSDIQSNS